MSDGGQLAEAPSNKILPFQAKHQKVLEPLRGEAGPPGLAFSQIYIDLFLLPGELGPVPGSEPSEAVNPGTWSGV